MAIVELKDVHKVYPLGKTEVHAVQGVSSQIRKGDFISIAGPSGSGKSTILNMLGCIDVPTEGSVIIDEVDTKTLSDKQITNLRHRFIGFIFQSFNLIPVFNVFENIEFPLLLGKGKWARKETRKETRKEAKKETRKEARKEAKKETRKEKTEWIEHLIEQVGLSDWRSHRPNELSGGQRQRVAIARALVGKPRVILADEPTANLDSKTGEQIIELMKKINREQETTFIFSTHDPEIVDIADHIIRLQDGKILREERRDQ